MPAPKISCLTTLICAGLFCASTAWAQTAGENAVQAAMDACEQEKEMEDSRMNCHLGVMAAHQSMQHASEGTEGTIHVDFDDSNDTEAQQAAKKALYSALNDCEMSGDKGSQISNCRMEAFHSYQEGMSE